MSFILGSLYIVGDDSVGAGWALRCYIGEAPGDARGADSGPLLEEAGCRELFYKEIHTIMVLLALSSFPEIEWHWGNKTKSLALQMEVERMSQFKASRTPL